MIDNNFAKIILNLTKKYNLKGHAFCFGDQKTTFSKEYLDSYYKVFSGKLIETKDFFLRCGYSEYTDIDYNGNAKLSLDLGKPIPNNLHNSADFLYDGGTIEHIPNILQAVTNSVLLCKKGGIVIHGVPFGIYNNCYYHIDPLFFQDFFTANGFEVIDIFQYYRRSNFFWKLFKYFENRFASFCSKQYPQLYQKLRKTSVGKKLGANIKSMKYYENCQVVITSSMLNKFTFWGFPMGTHTAFIGRKIKDVKTITIPTQEIYPSNIGTQ